MASDFENAAPTIWLQITYSNRGAAFRSSTGLGLSAIFITAPDGGHGAGRLGQGSHISTVPPFSQANTTGIPPVLRGA